MKITTVVGHRSSVVRAGWIMLGAGAVTACSRGTAGGGTAPAPAAAEAPAPTRVGLAAGYGDAATASWNLRLVANAPRPASLRPPRDPGDFNYMNSDLAFAGTTVFQGNFYGLQAWDVSNPAAPRQILNLVCPGMQNDVSVYRNLLFVSVEDERSRMDCGTQGIQDTVSRERVLGIRIFDITNVAQPRQTTVVQTCRGSHTHTLVTDPRDSDNVYIYVSGSSPARSGRELAGCTNESPSRNPNSSLFRIEVIQVPLANPAAARIVSSPRIFEGLTAAPSHGPADEDAAAQRRQIEAARARGMFVVTILGQPQVVPPSVAGMLLDSIMQARGGSGRPTAADSATLRGAIQGIADQMVAREMGDDAADRNRGPSQCHDITVYPAIGLAGGACGGYGLLLDISDVRNPRRIAAAADSNFAYWHSATFNNDGTAMLFTDEWGGGTAPRCRASDRREWGANAQFRIVNRQLVFQGYWKLPEAQTPQENCVAHNGSLIPVPGRDIMAQGWYQGGVSVFDWTDPANPVEIAYFDRGPLNAQQMGMAGSWSAYWYNGYIYSSEIARGLDILELVPSRHLSANEIAAAREVRTATFNPQHQERIVWAPSFAVARSYVDQLERGNAVAADVIAQTRSELDAAERATGDARRTALTALAGRLQSVSAVRDAEKMRRLVQVVGEMAR